MTQNDKANLEEMVRCCRQMEAFTGRYDHICIRFYGDAMNTPALLDNCAEQLLELGRIADAGPAGEISEIHAGKNYFRNPFGLKGVFATAYTSSHEYTD